MKKIVIIGAGVAGINAATKLVDNGYDGSLITIIDKGNDPINRLPEEVMTGMLGAGGWSDGKLVVSTVQGGQLSKYCGEEKAIAASETGKTLTMAEYDSLVAGNSEDQQMDEVKRMIELANIKTFFQ